MARRAAEAVSLLLGAALLAGALLGGCGVKAPPAAPGDIWGNHPARADTGR